MRVMISQPICGLTEEQASEERAEAAAMLEKQGHEVADTGFDQTEAPEGVNAPLWLLGKALQAMAQVDAVYFMDGWEKARGCRLEYQAAVAYGLLALNVEVETLNTALSIEQTLFECFPDMLGEVEDVHTAVNRIIRYALRMRYVDQEEWKEILKPKCVVCGQPIKHTICGLARQQTEVIDKNGNKLIRFQSAVRHYCKKHLQQMENNIAQKEHIELCDFKNFGFGSKPNNELSLKVAGYYKRILQNAIDGLEKREAEIMDKRGHSSTMPIKNGDSVG